MQKSPGIVHKLGNSLRMWGNVVYDARSGLSTVFLFMVLASLAITNRAKQKQINADRNTYLMLEMDAGRDANKSAGKPDIDVLSYRDLLKGDGL